ncbi:MAG TPA: GIDE domain-containing protein [Candidatus Acidoferrales bacterium]|nr:GIDE domain-containing protein [Candidatus Acidoferrales bacterium]
MDPAVLYFLAFFLCLFLSWYLYKRFFADGSLEDKFFALVNSAGRFIFGLIASIIIPAVMLSVGYFTSVVIFYLFVGFSLLFLPQRRVIAGIFLICAIIVAMVISMSYTSLTSYMKALHSVISTASIMVSFFLAIIGSILFQSGFGKMHELQVMQNIPRSKIRSVAIGPVEISGTIVSRNVLTTPYSKSPCVYCTSSLEICTGSEDQHSDEYNDWQKMPGPTYKVPFWVKDDTGEIMVDPQDAEVKISDREFGMLNADGTPNDTSDVYSADFSPKAGDKHYIEQFLAPNDPVFILGTATVRKDGTTEQLVIQEGAETPFVISESREQYTLHQEKWGMIAGLSYGAIIFLTGFSGILYLSNLL